MIRRAHVALGANLGDRAAALQHAVEGLDREPEIEVVAVSAVYETDPVGPDQPDYLNAVVALDTSLSPRALLAVAQRLEAEALRVRGERWGPRTLDVDVLLVGDLIVDEPDLEVPHPRMWERGFVLAPLADVAPELVSPPPGGWVGVRSTSIQLLVPRAEDTSGRDRSRG